MGRLTNHNTHLLPPLTLLCLNRRQQHTLLEANSTVRQNIPFQTGLKGMLSRLAGVRKEEVLAGSYSQVAETIKTTGKSPRA